MNAQADVVVAARRDLACSLLLRIATWATTLIAILNALGGAVVARTDDPVLLHDHRAHVAAQAAGAFGDSKRDIHVVVVEALRSCGHVKRILYGQETIPLTKSHK